MHRSIYFLFLISFLSLSALWAQSPSFEHKNFFEEIPFRFVKGKVLIPVQIEGETYDFILDSGGLLVLSNRVANRCQFDTLGKRSVTGVTKNSATFARVRVPEVKIGGLSFKNFQGLSGSFFEKYPVECLGADGIIGRDFMQYAVIQYDLKGKKVILTDQPERLNLEQRFSQKMKMVDGGVPVLTLKTSRGKLKHVKFDSGSDDLLSIKTSTASRLVEKAAYDGAVQRWLGTFSLGISLTFADPREQYSIYYPTVEICKSTLSEIQTEMSLASGSRIGAGLFPFGKVTTDYFNKRFYFEPYDADSLEASAIQEPYGVRMMFLKDTLRIAGILKGSPAEKAGLQPGQVVSEVNNYAASGWAKAQQCEAFMEGFPWRKSDYLELKLLRDDNDPKFIRLTKSKDP